MRFPLAAVALACAFAWPAAAADAPVEVMIVGTFHMGNPGHDLHNVQVADVLLPKYQAQIQAVVDSLAKFHPTMIDVEWDQATVDERWPKYADGTLPPSRNEVVQLGFRLAKTAHIAAIHGVDVDGDFPYEAVETYAKAHGQAAILEAAHVQIQAMVDKQTQTIVSGGISAALRYLNDPRFFAHANDFYRQTLRIGGGTTQPGADLLTAWYRRNFLICANIIQLAKPGDHIVVFYGSGHSFLLRQCIQETPGFRLVEANDYLPR